MIVTDYEMNRITQPQFVQIDCDYQLHDIMQLLNIHSHIKAMAIDMLNHSILPMNSICLTCICRAVQAVTIATVFNPTFWGSRELINIIGSAVTATRSWFHN